MELSEIIHQRRSVKSYDPERSITDEELQSLFEDVSLSPSSFNLQHWVFIAFRDRDRKQQLRSAAWGQEQVGDCSVALVVCGKLSAYGDAPEIYKEAPVEIQGKVLPMIHGFYEGKDRLQRDEAIRSASLAAMTLMYAAYDRGWATCPMIGFDAEAVSRICELDDNHIPVMMVTLGFQKTAPRPRSFRRPIPEIVRFNTLNGPRLGKP